MTVETGDAASPERYSKRIEELVITHSPTSTEFRRAINNAGLFDLMSSPDGKKPNGEIIFILLPLIEWDGAVHKTGERKKVQLIPLTVDKAGVKSIEVRMIRVINESEIHDFSVRIRKNLGLINQELFVYSGYGFISYFQTICKAIEDGVPPDSVNSAVLEAITDLERLGSVAKNKPNDFQKREHYAQALSQRFREKLAAHLFDLN